MRRHNQRIYRAARAILRDETEVEDVMQQAYINAFTHLHQFEERSRFSTWLTRIAVNEAIGRRQRMRRSSYARNRKRSRRLTRIRAAADTPNTWPTRASCSGCSKKPWMNCRTPIGRSSCCADVEDLGSSETGEALELGDEAVKTRLHRARAMLHGVVASRIGGAAASAFRFHAPRSTVWSPPSSRV